MNPLLVQFLSESRDFSQDIGQKLLQMEDAPSDQGLINELFRLVHTLKGNSGLFTFPEMTRVLHAGEDLLGMVRDGRIAYSRELADRLLNAIDFVMELCADIESTERIDASRAKDAARMTESLRGLMPAVECEAPASARINAAAATAEEMPTLAELPGATREELLRHCRAGEALNWISYAPVHDCFFQGDDPFFDVNRGFLGRRLRTGRVRDERIPASLTVCRDPPLQCPFPVWTDPSHVTESHFAPGDRQDPPEPFFLYRFRHMD